MKRHFKICEVPPRVSPQDWSDWHWQMRKSLQSPQDFAAYKVQLTEDLIRAFESRSFQVRSTPYYAQVALQMAAKSALHKILVPDIAELTSHGQQMLDPLAEKKHSPVSRIIHRYTDRVLFLVTDTCSVYCRYCTRKHFTAQGEAGASSQEYSEALEYIRSHPEVREVILSGGDPLTLSDERLEGVMGDLRQIDSVEIIRVATRMPVVCPMRITDDLVNIFKAHKPVFMMTHFNHPEELTSQAAIALEKLVDNGVPTFNQMVLLNGINNHSAIVRELSYRLLLLRVKPYYMFHCDPSEGSAHFRTSVENSLQIQRELWGRTSGLAMPNLSLDIPGGGGKVGLTPNFEISHRNHFRTYVGWDGLQGVYESPPESEVLTPPDADLYQQ